MRSTSVWEIAVIAVFLVLLLPGLNAAYSDATVTETIDNESLTVDYSVPADLEASDVVSYGNATVFNSTGAELAAGTDYDYDQSNGTVQFLNTANTTSGNTATVTYDYETRQDAAAGVATLLAPMGSILGWLLMAAALGAVLLYGLRLGGDF